MRFSFTALVLLATPLLAVAMPPQVQQVADQLRLGKLLDGDDDKCPDLKVRCFKDGKLSQPIGDIGKQSYCWNSDDSKCEQCHQTKNNALCNAKYLRDCAAKCEAIGTPI